MEFKVDRIALKLNLPSWKHIFFCILIMKNVSICT